MKKVLKFFPIYDILISIGQKADDVLLYTEELRIDIIQTLYITLNYYLADTRRK